MIETIWMMDSECCSGCGALLDYFEVDLCFFCEEEEHGVEMALEEDWWTEEDEDDYEPPTVGTPEEAYAVELSLSDAEVERLLADVD